MGSDGNCLFRAVAFQLYGNEEMYDFLRGKCMDYVFACKDYFKDFIDANIDGTIDNYCTRKKHDKVWGDDIEIEALSEIYGRPIEIYAYSA
jgi:OTU domain-containing protein 5